LIITCNYTSAKRYNCWCGT